MATVNEILSDVANQVAKLRFPSGVIFKDGNPVDNTEKYINDFGSVVSREVRTTAFLIQRDAKKILNTPNEFGRVTTNLGLLRDSIKVDIRGDGAKTTAIVFVGKEYGVWVEFGRRGLKSSPKDTNDKNAGRAAWPPFAPIFQWVKERGIFDNKISQSSITYLIQRKIANHGIKPQPYLLPAYRLHIKKFKERIAEAVKSIRL